MPPVPWWSAVCRPIYITDRVASDRLRFPYEYVHIAEIFIQDASSFKNSLQQNTLLLKQKFSAKI